MTQDPGGPPQLDCGFWPLRRGNTSPARTPESGDSRLTSHHQPSPATVLPDIADRPLHVLEHLRRVKRRRRAAAPAAPAGPAGRPAGSRPSGPLLAPALARASLLGTLNLILTITFTRLTWFAPKRNK